MGKRPNKYFLYSHSINILSIFHYSSAHDVIKMNTLVAFLPHNFPVQHDAFRLKKKTNKKNSLFCIGVQLINNIVIVSGGQQTQPYIHVSIFPQTPLPPRLPHSTVQSSMNNQQGPSIQQVLVGYSPSHFLFQW